MPSIIYQMSHGSLACHSPNDTPLSAHAKPFLYFENIY